MRISNYKRVFAFVLIASINTVQLIAKSNPTPPRGSGGFDDGTVVGGAIDSYLILMFFIALLFGTWTMNKIKNTALVKA